MRHVILDTHYVTPTGRRMCSRAFRHKSGRVKGKLLEHACRRREERKEDTSVCRSLARSLARSATFFLSQWKSTTRKGASFVRKRGRKSNDIADDVAPLSASLSLSFFFSSLFVLALKACALSYLSYSHCVRCNFPSIRGGFLLYASSSFILSRKARRSLPAIFFRKYPAYTSSCFHFGLPAAISVRFSALRLHVAALDSPRSRHSENNKFLDNCVT